MAKYFWDAPACCKNTAFASKVMILFESSEHMINDPQLQATLRVLVDRYKVTDMHSERLLATVRRCRNLQGAPTIEHARASGFVASIVARCSPGGRRAKVKRARMKLLTSGVALRRARKALNKTASKSASGFSLWSSGE